MGHNGCLMFCQITVDEERRVSRRIIVVDHPSLVYTQFRPLFSCISQLIHLCRSNAFWIWEFSTTTFTLPILIKLTWKLACFSFCLLNCSSKLRTFSFKTACRHKLVFELMFHLLYNTVIYAVTPQNHFDVYYSPADQDPMSTVLFSMLHVWCVAWRQAVLVW